MILSTVWEINPSYSSYLKIFQSELKNLQEFVDANEAMFPITTWWKTAIFEISSYAFISTSQLILLFIQNDRISSELQTILKLTFFFIKSSLTCNVETLRYTHVRQIPSRYVKLFLFRQKYQLILSSCEWS